MEGSWKSQKRQLLLHDFYQLNPAGAQIPNKRLRPSQHFHVSVSDIVEIQTPTEEAIKRKVDPRKEGEGPSVAKCNNVSERTPCRYAQPPNPAASKLLGLRSPPHIIHANDMSEPIRVAFKDAATRVQSDLLTLLESIDPSKHELMVREANSAFAALNQLGVDYRPFHENVKEFIECKVLLATIESTISNDVSTRKLVDSCNIEKNRVDEISCEHAEALAGHTSFMKRLQPLRDEAARLRDSVRVVDTHVSCFASEMVDVEARFVEASRELQKSKRKVREAEEAITLPRQREEERAAAKAAWDKARLRLRE